MPLKGWLNLDCSHLSTKLWSWETFLGEEIIDIKKNWSEGGELIYHLIGDTLDKNIIPTYRTSQIKTISLHLFNVIAVLDSLRVIPSTSLEVDEMDEMGQMSAINYIPPNVIRLCSNGHIDNSKPGTNAWHFWTQSVWNLDTVNS